MASHLQFYWFLSSPSPRAPSRVVVSDQQMLRGGRVAVGGGMGLKARRNKVEVAYTSILEGYLQLAGVLEGHTEVALLPPSNEVDGQRYRVANLGRRSKQRGKQAAHLGHSQRYSSLR